MDCVGKVRTSLTRVSGVRSVEVDLASQRATVVCAGSVADTSLTAAVRQAGEGYIGLVIRP
jgi:copper chaperone CopZ